MLDGDNVGQGLNKDLGVTDAVRIENLRRIAEAAKLLADAELVVTAFISPPRSEQDMPRSQFDKGDFRQVFVDTTLNLAEQSYWRGSPIGETTQPPCDRLESQLTCQYRLWYSPAMTFSADILNHIQQADTEAATLTPKQLRNTQQKRMRFTHKSQYGPYYAAS